MNKKFYEIIKLLVLAILIAVLSGIIIYQIHLINQYNNNIRNIYTDVETLIQENIDLKEQISNYYIAENDNEEPETVMEESASAEEEKSVEVWDNTPAYVKELTMKDGFANLTIDILTKNPNWPRSSDGSLTYELYINQSPKLREVRFDNSTKSYGCEYGEEVKSVEITTPEQIDDIYNKLSKYDSVVYIFDIEGDIVKGIYQQCLP